MTYFQFLLIFLVLPILLLALPLLRRRPASLRETAAAVGTHVLLALLYTTPWDNYLVATGVWYYNPALVSGILLGWVPLEEYTFFVLETVLVGLWWLRMEPLTAPRTEFRPSAALRKALTAMGAAVWLVSALVFFSGWQPGTYLSIMLFWGLPPLLLQLGFGADILLHHWRRLAAVILPLGLFLSLADSLAITATTWTIAPANSLGFFIGGLPIEEGLFFFLTVTLVTVGVTLLMEPASRERLDALRRRWAIASASSARRSKV